MTFGSLFAGIGGFDLGLEKAGMTCKWQVEIRDHARRVLAKHWPDVQRHDDVRSFPPVDSVDDVEAYRVDVICGGFPCQDISNAGRREGIKGKRSGLWKEFHRIVRQLRPSWVILENVAALKARGLPTVVGDLAEIGYDAEWDCVPASSVGAHHQRDRIWIVAYPECAQRWPSDTADSQVDEPVLRLQRGRPKDSSGLRFIGSEVFDVCGERPERPRIFGAAPDRIEWPAEPDVRRMANGVPFGMDRLVGLGNSIVHQIPEWIGRRIMSYHN